MPPLDPPRPQLDLAAVLTESEVMPGALGALAYVILKGLKEGGAEDQVVASVRALMHEHFQRLSDADCNTLCQALMHRLQNDAIADGRWY